MLLHSKGEYVLILSENHKHVCSSYKSSGKNRTYPGILSSTFVYYRFSRRRLSFLRGGILFHTLTLKYPLSLRKRIANLLNALPPPHAFCLGRAVSSLIFWKNSYSIMTVGKLKANFKVQGYSVFYN